MTKVDVYLISNVIILIAVTLICAFFGVEPKNRFRAAVMTSVIFSLIYAKRVAQERPTSRSGKKI